jgi:hypothetical protein
MNESIMDSLSHLFAKISIADILHTFGVGRRRVSMTGASGVSLFATGAIIGAGVALFLAPKSGRELRSDVTAKAVDLKDQISGMVGMSKGNEKLNQSSSSVSKPSAHV